MDCNTSCRYRSKSKPRDFCTVAMLSVEKCPLTELINCTKYRLEGLEKIKRYVESLEGGEI